MKKINILLAALVILFTASCQDFLDVRPSNYKDADYAIEDAEDAGYLISGLMSKMTSSSYYGRNFPMYADAKGGDFTTFSAGNGGDGWYYFTHRPNSNSYSGYWTKIYDCLLQANYIIEKCEELKKQEVSGLDSYHGQALTLRALFHFDLVRLYGKPYNMDNGAGLGVPVVTKVLEPYAKLTRNTVKEVYTQIVADLEAAAPLMSKKVSNGYVNYYGNRAILAKVHMYMDNFDKALALAEEVIDKSSYELYTNAEWTLSWSKEFGTESILELAILPTESDLGTSSLGAYYRRRAHGMSGGGVFLASQYWFDIMGKNDIRWGVMDYDQSDKEDDTGRMGANYKYSGTTDLKGDGKGNSTAVNVKIIRLSEVYLNAAECAVRTGDQAKAKKYLEAIAKRNPDWKAPATITVEDVMDERRRELTCEGVVYFEYMRQNMTIKYEDDAFGNSTTPPNSGRGSLENGWVTRDWFKTILPIGQDELNANPNLKDQQNPGY